MRLAFVDLEFSWPPPGGAQIDLVNTMLQLQALGHDVQLFCPATTKLWRFNCVDENLFPLPITQLWFDDKPYPVKPLCGALKAAVDEWRPDVVFLCFGFFLKPYVAEALSHYPLVARYFTYEMACVRDIYLYKHETTCPYGYLDAPNVCRRCFARTWGYGLRRNAISQYAQEFLQLDGFSREYHSFFVKQIERLDAIIVYNEMTQARLSPHNAQVHVVPGGVNIADFENSPLPVRETGEKKIIFMGGRANDFLKGLITLIRAGMLLETCRNDFEIHATFSGDLPQRPWLKFVGWRPPEEMRAMYARSDVCVVPSVWDEPFGLVAVESMAVGRPVCASRVGGLQHIVQHDETGFLFERDNAVELATYLDRLLDQPELRASMGAAGRKRVEEHYDWRHVVAKHYPPILDRVVS